MDNPTLVKYLLTWFAQHKRPLPWRQDRDPYKIWLSEVILQQTRVAQGQPYYQRFITTYPTVYDLAAASEQDVLHLWQGLGYYSRARNLHKCSRYIVEKLGGIFPKEYKDLIKLPGIGPYTAAAIASIAFNQPIAVVDGNVYRVLARLFGLEDDIASPSGQKVFRQLAATLVPQHKPGTYNEALMEFGALHCTPQQPKCSTCPFQKSCIAYLTHKQHLLPVKKRHIKIKDRYLHYIIIHSNDQVYVKQRKQKDIWHGLYDFYLIESSSEKDNLYNLDDPLITHIKNHRLQIQPTSYPIHHQLTHQRLHLRFFHIHATNDFIAATAEILDRTHMHPHPFKALHTLPFPKAIHRFFEQKTPLLS